MSEILSKSSKQHLKPRRPQVKIVCFDRCDPDHVNTQIPDETCYNIRTRSQNLMKFTQNVCVVFFIKKNQSVAMNISLPRAMMYFHFNNICKEFTLPCRYIFAHVSIDKILNQVDWVDGMCIYEVLPLAQM